uniref:Uncharacterized protein n=1 Tax=Solanum tuberosum TaxID=4113 RepID=M1E027_SOLTU
MRNDRPPGNIPNLPKIDPLAAPSPYTVAQTYADRLRYNQAKCDVSITLTAPEITTKQGLPAVLEDITDGRWQKIEYDNIPDYCFYCKHQGQLDSDCTIRQRYEDKKKKELENVRNKHNIDKDNNPQQSKSHKESEHQEDNNQHYKQQRYQEHMQYQQDDQWQTHKEKEQ